MWCALFDSRISLFTMAVFAFRRMEPMATSGSVCTSSLHLREVDKNLDATEMQTQTLGVNWP